MRASEFDKMRALESSHWWFRGRRYLLQRLVRKLGLRNALILDAGCGTGFASRELAAAGKVISLDASEAALGPHFKGDACIADIRKTPFPDGTFDLIVAMDLLEHLEDDRPALEEMYRICKPGGALFVTVPAFQRLFSSHDKALGHYRRYSAADLRRSVGACGFEIRRLSYIVTAVFPIAAVYRAVRRKRASEDCSATDLFPVPEPFNAFLSLLILLESWLVWHIRLPFGLTVLVFAAKPRSEPAS
jgi:SAM-dependent methyltransferase